jgi:hypothetical protein
MDDPPSSMTETVAGMREILFDQTRLIDSVLQHLTLHRDGKRKLASGEVEVLRIITTMVDVAGISGHSILKLTENANLQVRDAYPVARSIVEAVVNIIFIMASGKTVAEKAERHAKQKAIRELDRGFQAGGINIHSRYKGHFNDEASGRVEELLTEFTSKKGREKDWTHLSVRECLDAIEHLSDPLILH